MLLMVRPLEIYLYKKLGRDIDLLDSRLFGSVQSIPPTPLKLPIRPLVLQYEDYAFSARFRKIGLMTSTRTKGWKCGFYPWYSLEKNIKSEPIHSMRPMGYHRFNSEEQVQVSMLLPDDMSTTDKKLEQPLYYLVKALFDLVWVCNLKLLLPLMPAITHEDPQGKVTLILTPNDIFSPAKRCSTRWIFGSYANDSKVNETLNKVQSLIEQEKLHRVIFLEYQMLFFVQPETAIRKIITLLGDHSIQRVFLTSLHSPIYEPPLGQLVKYQPMYILRDHKPPVQFDWNSYWFCLYRYNQDRLNEFILGNPQKLYSFMNPRKSRGTNRAVIYVNDAQDCAEVTEFIEKNHPFQQKLVINFLEEQPDSDLMKWWRAPSRHTMDRKVLVVPCKYALSVPEQKDYIVFWRSAQSLALLIYESVLAEERAQRLDIECVIDKSVCQLSVSDCQLDCASIKKADDEHFSCRRLLFEVASQQRFRTCDEFTDCALCCTCKAKFAPRPKRY